MWSDEHVAAMKARLAHVWACAARLASEPCSECSAAMVAASRMIPAYDPWDTAGDCVFDVGRAVMAVGFFHDHLVFIEGERAGQPFDLEPWQAAIVANLFGWLRPLGIRRFREFFLLVAAKNGKTPLAAGIVILLLLCDDEPGAQVFSAAGEKEQAALIYRFAAEMIARNPELAAMCRPYRAFKSIEVPATTSFFRSLSSDADTKHGLNAHGVIVDELHAHKNRRLVDVLKTRTTSRRQPVIGYITTADYERPSICNEVYHYACKVRDGVIKAPHFLPVIYEAGKDDDICSPLTWRKANPNLGVSVREDTLREESGRAMNSPGYRDEFKRTNLNIRTNAKVSAIDPLRWAACAQAIDGPRSLRVPDLRAFLKGKRCYGGLDLAATTDLASLALFFPEDCAALWFNWCPRDSASDREMKDRVPYPQWAAEGALILTGSGPDERSVDYRRIRTDIVALHEEFQIQELAFDRYAANETITELKESQGVKVLQFGQGFLSMAAPSKELDRLVNGRACLAHGRDPVATWAASNLVWAIDDAGNWKPSKKRSTERIDPMVSLVMAIGAMLLQPTGPTIVPDFGSVIDSGGGEYAPEWDGIPQ